MPDYIANKASTPGNSDPKPDSVSTCLQRIEAHITEIAVEANTLNRLADRIDGGSARDVSQAGGLVPPTPAPEPSHILFRAHRIESSITDHLKALQDIRARFDTYL